MALRSLLRKVPALGLSSVRGLSPAAGRFLSHGRPGGEIISQEELDRGWAKIDRRNAQFYKDLEAMRERRRLFIKQLDADIAQHLRTKKEHEMMLMASNAVIILSVSAILYMSV